MKPQEQDSPQLASNSDIPNWAEVKIEVTCTSEASESQIGQLSPASLAYLGDAVYEIYVRTHYLLPPRRMSDYHNRVVAKVRAESQAAYLRTIEPYLTDSEREIIRRGRNAATTSPRRLSPELYQQATSFETLLGYLYLKNSQRLYQLLSYLKFDYS